MTDDDKALVEQLAAEADNFKVAREVDMRAMLYRAADRIEALEAEVERLRERVKRVENNNRELRGSKERVYAATDLRQPTQSDALLTKMNEWCEAVAVEWGQGSQTHNVARDDAKWLRIKLDALGFEIREKNDV